MDLNEGGKNNMILKNYTIVFFKMTKVQKTRKNIQKEEEDICRNKKPNTLKDNE